MAEETFHFSSIKVDFFLGKNAIKIKILTSDLNVEKSHLLNMM